MGLERHITVRIDTIANPAGAKSLQEVVRDITKAQHEQTAATGAARDATEKATAAEHGHAGAGREAIAVMRGLGHELGRFPGLMMAIHAVRHPIMLIGAAVGAAVMAVKEKLDELHKAVEMNQAMAAMAAQAQAMKGVIDNEFGAAARQFKREMGEIAMRAQTASEKLSLVTQELREQAQLMKQQAEAEKAAAEAKAQTLPPGDREQELERIAKAHRDKGRGIDSETARAVAQQTLLAETQAQVEIMSRLAQQGGLEAAAIADKANAGTEDVPGLTQKAGLAAARHEEKWGKNNIKYENAREEILRRQREAPKAPPGYFAQQLATLDAQFAETNEPKVNFAQAAKRAQDVARVADEALKKNEDRIKTLREEVKKLDIEYAAHLKTIQATAEAEKHIRSAEDKAAGIKLKAEEEKKLREEAEKQLRADAEGVESQIKAEPFMDPRKKAGLESYRARLLLEALGFEASDRTLTPGDRAGIYARGKDIVAGLQGGYQQDAGKWLDEHLGGHGVGPPPVRPNLPDPVASIKQGQDENSDLLSRLVALNETYVAAQKALLERVKLLEQRAQNSAGLP